MALGTLAMATVVAYYNRKTLRQTQQQIQIMSERTKIDLEQIAIARQQLDKLTRERERPQVVELLKSAIVPLLRQVVEELGALEKREYFWIHKAETSRSMSMLSEVAIWEGKAVIEDLKRKFPGVKEIMDSHDRLIIALNENLKALDKVIYTSEFVEKCKKAIETYNASYPKGSGVRESEISDAPQIFVSYVIDNLRELPKANPYRDFWKKHSSQFLEIREKEEVKNGLENVEGSTKKLVEISLSLTKDLGELWGKLKEEYWIAEKEIGVEKEFSDADFARLKGFLYTII